MVLNELISELKKIKKLQLSYLKYTTTLLNINKINEEKLLQIYRNQNKIEKRLNKIKKNIFNTITEKNLIKNMKRDDVIISFNIDSTYLNFLKYYDELYEKILLDYLEINISSLKYELTLRQLINCIRYENIHIINSYIAETNQQLLNKPIYIFIGYDESYDEEINGLYIIPFLSINHLQYISKDKMNEFENNKRIISTEKKVYLKEDNNIFYEELLNHNNTTIDECIIKTKNRIKKLIK